MDSYRIKKILKKIGILLASPGFKELLVFFVFLCISMLLWVMLTMDETLENTVEVDVELVGVPEDIIITSPCADRIAVVVRDKGTNLFHYFRHRPQPISIPFGRLRVGSMEGRAMLGVADLQHMIQDCLLSSTKIQRIQPDSLEVYFARGNEKKVVPVRIRGTVSTAAEYYLDSLYPKPEKIEVRAPRSILDTLSAVYTQPLDLKYLTKSVSAESELTPLRGVMFSQPSVHVDAKVDFYIEQSHEVPILVSNFPADKNLRLFPSREVKVTYIVGYAHAASISKEDFVLRVTYEEILKYQEQRLMKIPLHLRSYPDGITNIRIEPQQVDYLIETTSSK